MMYDPRCYELAEIFLEGEPTQSEEQKQALAQHIQDAIEEWLESERLK